MTNTPQRGPDGTDDRPGCTLTDATDCYCTHRPGCRAVRTVCGPCEDGDCWDCAGLGCWHECESDEYDPADYRDVTTVQPSEAYL